MSDKLIKQEIEVLPADGPKQLKLSWTVSETIGVAIINPRAVSGMKAVPKIIFENESGSIEIQRYSVEIKGSIEGAALAFAEDVLKSRNREGDANGWNYLSIIEVKLQDGVYTLNLMPNGLGIFDPDAWIIFKKNAEKICNNLTVFL